MICGKCGSEVKKGKVSFRNGGLGAPSLLDVPTADFKADEKAIDTLSLGTHDGLYCPACGQFVVTFSLKKNVLFEKGFDMNFNENIDCLPQKKCPRCGKEIDIDYPKCPECGCEF